MAFALDRKNSALVYLSSLLFLACATDSSSGIVTQYGPPTTDPDFVTTPGQPMFGLDHDFIVQINAKDGSGGLIQEGTGILLSTGRHILTAAHLGENASEVTIRLDSPWESFEDTVNVSTNFHEHDFYFGTQFGYDLAVIELSYNFIDRANNNGINYTIAVPELLPKGFPNYQKTDLKGAEARFGGYGVQGQSDTGVFFNGASGFEKIVGKNTISDITDDFVNIFNEDKMLWWDFDDLQQVQPYNHYNDDLGYGAEEVFPVIGDSGGPVLVEVGGEWLVTGVVSGRLGDDNVILNPDTDYAANAGTRGEIGFATNILDRKVYTYIARTVWKIALHTPLQSWDGTWDDTTSWSNSLLPGAGESVRLDYDAGGSYQILGPSGSHTIEALDIGLSAGSKELLMRAGGSLSMSGNITVDTNGAIILEDGSLSADNLIIQGTANVPQTPTPTNGVFIWTDNSSFAGPTSLIVNRIEVGQNGGFLYNRSSQANSVFTAVGGGKVDMDVLAGGLAIFEWSNSDIGDLTNGGILSLGDDGGGDELTVDSYTQSAGGSTTIYLATTSIDRLFVTGAVTFAGELELRLLGTAATAGSVPILTFGSRVGAFDSVKGFSDLLNGMWMSLAYGPTALTGTIQLIGDLDGDGFVGITDLNKVLGNWNADVFAGSGLLGDPTGDGFVGIEDLNFVLGNWNAGTPPEASALVLVPEPGSLCLFSLGMGMLGFRPGRARKSCRQSYHVTDLIIRRSMAMRLCKPVATIAAAIVLMVSTSFSEAAISFDLSPVDNSALLTGYTTYDMQVTTDIDWVASAMLFELSAGSLYQHAYGADTGPPNPSLVSLFPDLAFDTYVIGSVAGGGGDVGGDGYLFDTSELDVSWYNMTGTDIGTTTIGRLTMTDDAAGSMSIMLTNDDKEKIELTITIDSGTAQAPMPSGGSLASKTGSLVDIESSFQALRDSIFDPGIVDTRVRTPIHSFSYDPIPTKTIIPAPGESLPEPATLMLLGTGLSLVLVRRAAG